MLEHITQTECDECGCSDIKTVARHTHFKELRYSEELAFDCGLKLRYSSKTERIEREEECRRSARAMKWAERREEIAVAIEDMVLEKFGKPQGTRMGLSSVLRSDLELFRDELEG